MRKRFLTCLAISTCSALFAVSAALAQSSTPSGQASSQAGNTTAGGAGQTTPATGGLSGGAAPIETTLFAYRSLQRNAEAIAAKIIDAGIRDHLVIGSQTDVSNFLQWRTIMGQAALLTSQLDAMNGQLRYLNAHYSAPNPIASLSIAKSHQGNFVKGQTGTYTLRVTNSPAASVTTGPVTVTENPPQGMTVIMSGNGWTCNPPPPGAAPSCTRNDPLGPGAVYDPITVSAHFDTTAPDSLTNTATVAGGNSALASATDVTSLSAAAAHVLPGGAARAPAAARFNVILPADNTGATGTTGTSAPTPSTPFATALSAIPTLTSLAQFIATSFAVSETLSPWQGNMTDLPLIDAVAGVLRQHGRTVLVPATYPPFTLTASNLEHTYLWHRLETLRDRRIDLWHELEFANGRLLIANFVIQNPAKYSFDDINKALAFAGEAQSLLTSAQTLAAGADSFIASLFGVQVATAATAPPSTAYTAGSSPAGSSTSPASATPSSGSTVPQTAAAPTAAPAAQTASSASPAPSQSGISLQQLLSSDLLAHRIFNDTPYASEREINSVNFLTMHALESGGTELVKTNIFYGQHIFFSGGSVVTFSLYRLEGDLRCAGTAFNYIGNVREKKVEHRLMEEDVRHSKALGFYCSDQPDETLVSEGMTKGEVKRALGNPDKMDHRGNVYFYAPRNLSVEFKGGVVDKIAMAP